MAGSFGDHQVGPLRAGARRALPAGDRGRISMKAPFPPLVPAVDVVVVAGTGLGDVPSPRPSFLRTTVRRARWSAGGV
ncbi:MAG: hypothetical protein ACLQRH_26590 [Acidimicrobiales bacterium]